MRHTMAAGLVTLWLLGIPVAALAVPIEQPELPRVVQDTVLQEAGSTALKHIERFETNGRVVYEVIWQLGSTDLGVLVDANGVVLDRLRRPAVD